MKKGYSKCISVVKRVVPQSWGTSKGTFVTDKVGDIEISFVEYSASKKVCLQPNIVEYSPGDQAPMYDLIIGKQTMHNLGVKLDFQEKTITIVDILLPWGILLICNSNLGLPGHAEKIPVLLKSQLALAEKPSAW
jgi:hypothetical protein